MIYCYIISVIITIMTISIVLLFVSLLSLLLDVAEVTGPRDINVKVAVSRDDTAG